MPETAAEIAAEFGGAVDLGVGEGLGVAVVPSEAEEGAPKMGELLFAIEAEPVFHSALFAV